MAGEGLVSRLATVRGVAVLLAALLGSQRRVDWDRMPARSHDPVQEPPLCVGRAERDEGKDEQGTHSGLRLQYDCGTVAVGLQYQPETGCGIAPKNSLLIKRSYNPAPLLKPAQYLTCFITLDRTRVF